MKAMSVNLLRRACRPSPGGPARASAARVIVAVAGSLSLSACQSAVLDPQGPVGVAAKTILTNSIVIMLAIVIPTLLATLAFAWWFRASNVKARYQPDFAYSGRIEFVTWSIPVLVVLFLGGIAWIGAHELDPAKPLASPTKPVEIQVVSLDWKWLFIYPDQGIASVNQIIVPAGVPLHFALTSASVMNAFFVPQLGSMIYTMNKMTTQLNLQADRPGVYFGLSSHYSGDGFSGMHFDMHAVSMADFIAWVQATRGSGPVLDTQSYRDLARQSMNVRPFTFGSADPGLFQDIVTQKLPPGPGPQIGQLAPDASPRAGH
jgi:cytochrome o ubiquinol oxidase subunit 2